MLGEKIKGFIHYDTRAEGFEVREALEELNQLLEYKEKCERLEKENEQYKQFCNDWMFQTVEVVLLNEENKQLKEGALLVKALKYVYTAPCGIGGLDDFHITYSSCAEEFRIRFKNGKWATVIDLYKQQLEKEGLND